MNNNLKERSIKSAKTAVSKVFEHYIYFIENDRKKTSLESVRILLDFLKKDAIQNLSTIENQIVEFVISTNYNTSEYDTIKFAVDSFNKLLSKFFDNRVHVFYGNVLPGHIELMSEVDAFLEVTVNLMKDWYEFRASFNRKQFQAPEPKTRENIEYDSFDEVYVEDLDEDLNDEEEDNLIEKSVNIIYQEPEKRYLINKEYLRDIYNVLKSIYGNKITYETIDIEINFLFRSALSQGTSFPEGSFIKFRDFIKKKLDNETLFYLFKKYYIPEEKPIFDLIGLYNDNIIPFKILIGREKEFFLNKSESSAEFIGIMLGDGHLNENGIQVKVTLNAVDEPQFVLYVENLMMQLFNQHHIYIKYEKGFPLTKKGVHLTISSKSIHHSIVDLGLIAGDKIKNKATAPTWIFDNKLFVIKCLKGLFDTDGSISIYRPNKSLVVSFGSASKILTELFKNLCNFLEIDTQEISISKDIKTNFLKYVTNIIKKDTVKKFIDIINPEKLKEPYRWIWLGCQLIYLNAPIVLKEIINTKISIYKNEKNLKSFRYSKENSIFLKELCENEFSKHLNQEFKVTDLLINNAIVSSITLDTYGEIKLESSSDQIKEFPPKLRLEICQYIFELLIANPTINANNQHLNMIFENLIKQEYPNIINALKELRYKDTVFAYINSLIRLTQKIVDLCKNGLYYGAKRLSYNNSGLDLPFGRDIIEPILNYLKERNPKYFPSV